MYVSNKGLSKYAKVGIILTCIVIGLGTAKLYQPHGKTIKIYQQALKDYENKNFSNSYYLFSKVSYLSALKPAAIFRQALCAKALGDKKSEYRSYSQIIRLYPTNKLTPESKYLAGQIIIEENPNLALKYFNSVIKSDLDDDYKTASEYYKARILATRYRYSHNKFKIKPQNIEESFKKYLTDYPNGRLAVQVANTWKKYNTELPSEDLSLIAKAYHLAGENELAEENIKLSQFKDNWAVQSGIELKKRNFAKTRAIVELGVEKYPKINRDDYKYAVDNYLKTFSPENKLKGISNLNSKAKGANKDYILNLQCENSSGFDKYKCSQNFYSTYSKSEYTENMMHNILIYAISQQDYRAISKITQKFIEKYPNSSYLPQMKFWLAKSELKYGSQTSAKNHLKEIINLSPDSYYAYRAFWIVNNLGNYTLDISLKNSPVLYPYHYPAKGTTLHDILETKDYGMLQKYTSDLFIQSWAEHQRGNYASSVLLAKQGMDKLEIKPGKKDLRWRLVYPQNYYKQVGKYAQKYHTNVAIIMSIIREESHFYTEAQSGVGAMGLMQLMPDTAHEIGQKNGITLTNSYLLNPDFNIEIGNLYYSSLLKSFYGDNISAIAAYNGGIGSVSKWKSTFRYNDIDEFVEQIPYQETQNYIIKVMGSYWNYVRIYQKS